MPEKIKNLLDMDLKINGRSIKPDALIKDLGDMNQRYVNEIRGSQNISAEDLSKIINDLIFNVLSISIDYSQVYCSKMEEEYRALFLNTNTGIGFSDTKTLKVISVNPHFCKLLEIDYEDIVGKNIREFFDEYILDAEKYKKGRQIFKSQGYLDSYELKFKTKNSKEKYLLVSSKYIPELQQETFTMVDATELKEIELMREYTTNILTHDIRNPLAGAIGYIGILGGKSGSDEEKRIKMVAGVKNCLDRINNIIAEHLDIMKFEKGTYKLNLTEINLYEFISEICDKFNHIYGDKGCFVYFSTDMTYKPYEIYVDKKWLEHLFDNLIKNALDEAERNGSSVVEIFINSDKEDVITSINNKGVIPDDIRTSIFKKRYLNSTKTNGNGIGSYFAGLIARIHKGDVYVINSNIEDGTSIGVRLPLRKK